MKPRVLVAALAISFSCMTAENGAEVTVGNDTDQAIAVFAFDDGSLIDPILHLDPGEFEENLIRPGHHLLFNHIPGREPGEGVFLTVYLVGSEGADLAITRNVSADGLKALHGRISIDAVPTPRLIQSRVDQAGAEP